MVFWAVMGKIRILQAGNLSKNRKISGFTLIELILIISIMSILLTFSLPLFQNFNLLSNSDNVQILVNSINNLKKKAVEQHIDFFMNIDTGTSTIWVSNESMNEKEIEDARKKGYLIPENMIISEIKIPGIKERGIQEYQIRFNKKGYSDLAFIHIISNEKHITLKIQPFLSKVQLIYGQVVYGQDVFLEECI